MDRLQAMQEIREEMMKQWGGNWQEMSNDERRKMRQQMKDTWQEMGVDERRQTKNRSRKPCGKCRFLDIAACLAIGHLGRLGRLIIARRMIHGTHG